MRTENVADSELDKELGMVEEKDTTAAAEEKTFEVPQKFQGKEVEEIIQSYTELEKELGRKGNEIGELRKLTDSLVQKSLAETTPATSTKPTVEAPSEFDFDDPDKSVQERVESNPKIRALEERVAKAERLTATQDFERRHPDYQTVAKDPAFQAWVGESEFRTQMYADAHVNYNFAAADEILNLWKEHAKVAQLQSKSVEKEERKAKALDAASTTSSSAQGGSSKVYRRADIMKLMQDDPERYKALGPEIRKAYAEGRVR